jgi:hypothetical protein
MPSVIASNSSPNVLRQLNSFATRPSSLSSRPQIRMNSVAHWCLS